MVRARSPVVVRPLRPGRRRNGIATSLLRAVLRQGPVGQSLVLEGFARADWPAGLAFLAHFGFIETEIFMRCETLRPAPPGPAGILMAQAPDVEPILELIAAIHNEAYRDDAGFVRTTGADQRLRGHRARTRTRLAGTAGGRPMVQGAGFGEALARRALRGEGMDDGHPAGLSVWSRERCGSTGVSGLRNGPARGGMRRWPTKPD